MSESEFNPEEQIKKFLYDNKEERYYKRPSKYFLKKYAEKVLEVSKTWQKRNEFSLDSHTSVLISVKRFISDLDSDLEISNDKEYNIEWNNKYNEVRSIHSTFLKEYKIELENIRK